MKIEVDVKWQLLKIDGEIKYRMSQMESVILTLLIENQNKTISVERLAKIFATTERNVVSYISNIRNNYPEIANCIETVHGKGYRWWIGDQDEEQK